MAIYYISPTGNDLTGNGSIGTPYFSINKVQSYATSPGDIVYMRGGTYSFTGSDMQTVTARSCTLGNLISYLNYPNESPIFDFVGLTNTANRNGVKFDQCNYIYLKGLEVRNVLQYSASYNSKGIYFQSCTEVMMENCIVSNTGGHGVQFYRCDPVTVINCDSYNNYDDKGTGETSDGFNSWYGPDLGIEDGYHHYYYGCRSWNNSDDGFDTGHIGYVEYINCWSFNNGWKGGTGDGNGFKFGFLWTDIEPLSRKFNCCIAAYNEYRGFGENNDDLARMNLEAYNCLSYHNGVGFQMYTPISYLDNENIYKNNIAYTNTQNIVNTLYVHDHNSWDIPLTLSDADFVDLPADADECLTILGASRKSDGSLPSLGNYFHLASDSDCIGAGVNVGLITDGDGNPWNSTPSLGAFEYFPESVDTIILRAKIHAWHTP